MTLETPFRLMWTDEEGDNVCFSTDEELAQALKFVKGQVTFVVNLVINQMHGIQTKKRPKRWPTRWVKNAKKGKNAQRNDQEYQSQHAATHSSIDQWQQC